MRALLVLLSAALLLPVTAAAQDPGPPRRQIPPSVLVELAAVEDRFESALAIDCDPRKCFSKGCTYVAHAVADRPAGGSLPGLGFEPGPGSVEPQAWLTQARCTFAYEDGIDPADVQALARRLQSKASSGFAVVSVGHQALAPLPPHMTEPPEAPVDETEPVEPPPPPAPEPLTAGSAIRDLWASLLDDFPWMTGIVLFTLAAAALIWSWRRLGRESFEEKALLAQLAQGEDVDADAAEVAEARPTAPEADGAEVARQAAAWRLRLQALDLDRPDPELQAMIRQLLLAGELPLLAKAVLTFPETLPSLFPVGGDVAAAKVALAEHLRTVDPAALPSDAELFRALDRHAISAALDTQRDARVVRSLREEFGATGLVTLISGVPARVGALLFALAPGEVQHEMVRLLSPRQTRDLCERLLLSNRMGPDETAHLFTLLEAARSGEPLPETPGDGEISDHGAPFDATAALSILLPRVTPSDRGELFARALRRFGGSLPDWYRGILVPDMLFQLSDEARADLLLDVEVEPLAAWRSLLDPEIAESLFEVAPKSLRTSLRAASIFSSRGQQLALAERGRRELAAGLQTRLARSNVPFEQVVQAMAAGWA